MLRLADVLCRHGPDYVQRHAGALLPSHARAVRAITTCRTAALGGCAYRAIVDTGIGRLWTPGSADRGQPGRLIVDTDFGVVDAEIG